MKGQIMVQVKERDGPNIKVTPAPPHKPSAMPIERRLFLRALQGLRDGEAIRLYCDGSEDTSLVAEVTRNFTLRECKKGRLNHHFSMLKRKEGESSVIYVIKGQERRSKGGEK